MKPNRLLLTVFPPVIFLENDNRLQDTGMAKCNLLLERSNLVVQLFLRKFFGTYCKYAIQLTNTRVRHNKSIQHTSILFRINNTRTTAVFIFLYLRRQKYISNRFVLATRGTKVIPFGIKKQLRQGGQNMKIKLVDKT